MALPLWALTFLGLTGLGLSLRSRKPESFRSETELNHLAVDEVTGVVYVGAVNALYQLSADLHVQQHVVTGPFMDNKKCTPPIEASQCHEAVLTDNFNQLLLLDPPGKRLVECGSLFKGTLQQFVDNFFQSVLAPGHAVPPAVKYFFDFLDEQAEKHDIRDEDTIHIWKTNSLPLRFWVNILKNPHFIFDVHVHEVVDASLSVIAQTFMDACTRTEHKLSRDSPSNKLLYAKEISTYKKMVEDYYKGIRQMVQVSDQDMNTHLAEISRAHTDSLNTLVALHQLYQYTQKYYDEIINALEEDPAAQKMQLAFRLQQIAAALENKVTDL